MQQTLSQAERNERFFEIMRDYFLGFIDVRELSALAEPLGHSEEDVDYRRAHFEARLGEFMVPRDPVDAFILEPHRRRFFHDLNFLHDHAGERSVWRHAKPDPDLGIVVPSGCAAYYVGKKTYDVATTEFCGFVRIGDCLVSRTVQPYTMFGRNKKLDGVAGPLLTVIPLQTEEQFFDNFPFVRPTLEGATFTAQYKIVAFAPDKIEKYGLPCAGAFVCCAYKNKLAPSRSRSTHLVDVSYAKDLIL